MNKVTTTACLAEGFVMAPAAPGEDHRGFALGMGHAI